jgi:hypothetical protein
MIPRDHRSGDKSSPWGQLLGVFIDSFTNALPFIIDAFSILRTSWCNGDTVDFSA